jgi:predicted CXXCH cytochrome family protein
MGSYGDARRNHPIGVRYPRQGTTRAEMPLRPTSTLPPNVRLPGGTVSCISCHDLYNMDPKRLSVPITESQLCFTCHDMN